MQVGEYVNFGKNLKPLAEMDVEIVDSLTVDGSCNQAVATECVNSWLLGNTTDAQADTCITVNAKCQTKFDKLTDAEKQTLANKFNTRVENVRKAYEIV